MSDKFLLLSIILKKESTFTLSGIVSEAIAKGITSKDLEKDIKSIISVYIKNGVIHVNEYGYEICPFLRWGVV